MEKGSQQLVLGGGPVAPAHSHPGSLMKTDGWGRSPPPHAGNTPSEHSDETRASAEEDQLHVNS